jgi:hypothetical protein
MAHDIEDCHSCDRLKERLDKANAMLRKFAEFGYLNFYSGGSPVNDMHGCGPGCLHCEAFSILKETEKP